MTFIRRITVLSLLATFWVVAGGETAYAEEATSRFAPPTHLRMDIPSSVRPRWRTVGTQRLQRRRFSLELELGPVWQSRNEAAVPGDTGTRFDIDSITGSGPFPYGRITFDWKIRGRHSVRALIAPLEIEETGVLNQDVSFNGQTFTAGAQTKATYKFNSYRVGYRYRLWCGRCWELNVGGTIKIRDAEIGLQQGGVSTRKTDLGVVPLLHVDFEWRFHPGWRLVADVDGLGAPQGRAIDFALKVHRDLSERWSIGAGYRTIEGGADNDTIYTFAWLHQALVSVSYRF